MRTTGFLALMGMTICLTTALPASAGVPECGNIRFDGLANCELRVTGECTASCSELGIYKTACATKLVPVCKTQCTASANATCSDSCTTQCQTDCDNGINVICSHNCFAECTTGRDAKCMTATDGAQCSATWDANCDAECGAKCVTVDGACYTHCLECCDGSCTADANMDCQTTCQDMQFETCEQEFRANCDAACSGDGALFCGGKFIISGSQLPACLNALASQGINVKVEAHAEGSASLCSFSAANKASLAAPFAVFAAAAGWFARRRRRSSSPSN
jgi:hypothetical protein